jgi:hypothetical protein
MSVIDDNDDTLMSDNEAVLRLTLYPAGVDLQRSDQIVVPVRTWQNLYHGFPEEEGGRPLFVDVKTGGEDQWRPLVARIRPAGVGELEDDHSCRVPEWMWLHLGAPDMGGAWLTLTVTTVANVGTAILRPRRFALLEAGDPVEMLTAALTGAADGVSWAVLCAGAELPLWCGVFDVVGLKTLGGADMAIGCILDHDVTLELEPAPDTPVARPPTPPPSVTGTVMSFPGMGSPPPVAGSGARRGYIPFGGTGHTLGGSR